MSNGMRDNVATAKGILHSYHSDCNSSERIIDACLVLLMAMAVMQLAYLGVLSAIGLKAVPSWLASWPSIYGELKLTNFLAAFASCAGCFVLLNSVKLTGAYKSGNKLWAYWVIFCIFQFLVYQLMY